MRKLNTSSCWQTPLCPPCSNVLDFDDLLSLMVALLLDGELTTKLFSCTCIFLHPVDVFPLDDLRSVM